MFEFLICLGRANSEVKEQVDDLLEQVDRSNVDGWKASLEATRKDHNGAPIWQGKTWIQQVGERVFGYSKDLYGILVSMLDEELKRLVEGLVDQNKEYRCGFKALLVLSKRYGYKSRNKTGGVC